MNRVTTKVAQKIGVLFQHDDIHTRAGEQKAEHHSGRSAARDATSSGDVFRDFLKHKLKTVARVRDSVKRKESRVSCAYQEKESFALIQR